ncbi:MAG TPA: NACHT domain-containing protein [Pyrinomonadaceae bacterium]
MDLLLQPYLEMLKRHTSHIQVPGLKRNYSIPQAEIFIQPDITLPSATDNGREEQKTSRTRRGRSKKETEQEPKPGAPAVFEPALGVLGRENQIVVLGEPGQGKSTLLRQYAFELAAVGAELPLFVELGEKREWTGTQPDEYTWIRERIPVAPRDRLGDEPWAMCCRSLNEGRATLILDGLDELSEEARTQVINLLETVKGNRLIISSRPQAYSPLSGFNVYKLALLRSEQVNSLAANFCRAMAIERDLTDHTLALNKVLETARGNGWAMVQNPLLLYFICLTAFSEEFIPDKPVPLISKCIAELVLWEQRRPGSIWPKPEEFGAEDVIRVLGQLALNSFSQSTGVVSEAVLPKILSEEKDRVRLRELLVPAEFIEKAENGYRFTLDTFREYYAARAVAADKDPFGKVKRHLHLPDWQRVVLYTAGSLKDEKANWFHLKFPLLTTALVKVIGPVVRIGGGLIGLAPVPKPIADAGREGLKETASAIQGPLERSLYRSRHSTEFFITSIWKHHCRWKWMRYEWILWRDVRLAVRCLAQIEAGPERMVAPLAQFILKAKKGYRGFDFSEERVIAIQNPIVLRHWVREKNEYSRTKLARALAPAVAQVGVRKALLNFTRDESQQVRYAAIYSLEYATTYPDVQETLSELATENNQFTSLINDMLKRGKKSLADQPAPSRRIESSADEEEISVENIDAAQLQRLVKEARDDDAGVRYRAVKTLAAHRNQPEVLTELLRLTRGMGASPVGRLIDARPARVLYPFLWIYLADVLLERFAPQFTQNWYQPLKSSIRVRWSGGVQWLQSFTVVKWIEKPLDLLDRLMVSSPWLEWLILGGFVLLISFLPALVAWIMRGRHLKQTMLDVTANALNALQSWKGPVSRFTLWRIGNLARAQISPADKTLRVMLELWEQQQIRK